MMFFLQGLSVGDKLQDYPDYYRYSAQDYCRLKDVCLATIALCSLLIHQCFALTTAPHSPAPASNSAYQQGLAEVLWGRSCSVES